MISKREMLRYCFYYFVFVAFFFPKGLISYNESFKSVESALVWSATVLIWIRIINKIPSLYKDFKKTQKKTKINLMLLICYPVAAIIITILVRDSNAASGFQKLFAYPSVFLFTLLEAKNHPKALLNTVSNLLIMLFAANAVLTPLLFSDYLHITFLGHVQVIAQLGCLAIFTNVLFFLLYKKAKLRTILSCILVIFVMLFTDALSANIIAGLLVIVFIILVFKVKIIAKIVSFSPVIIIIASLITSVAVVGIGVKNYLDNNTNNEFLFFSGRSVVWEDAVSKIEERPIFGYGIDGVGIDVFWNRWLNSGSQLTYAHNQVLQSLLDGGIVLLICFVLFLYGCTKNFKMIKNPKLRCLFGVFLIMICVIMIFESPVFYAYFFILFSLFYSVPLIYNRKEKNDYNSKF